MDCDPNYENYVYIAVLSIALFLLLLAFYFSILHCCKGNHIRKEFAYKVI